MHKDIVKKFIKNKEGYYLRIDKCGWTSKDCATDFLSLNAKVVKIPKKLKLGKELLGRVDYKSPQNGVQFEGGELIGILKPGQQVIVRAILTDGDNNE